MKIDPLDRLKQVKQSADEEEQHRRNYQRFINDMRSCGGWTEQDVADYSAKIKVLFGKDDEAALALFGEGQYKTADEARNSAREFWKARLEK